MTGYSQSDSSVFGKNEKLTNSLQGKIYFIPDTSNKLPDFTTLKPVGTIYTQTINIPGRSWVSGFPGISDRFEWFAIEYKGYFKVAKTGRYNFKLISDDGSKLIIDNSIIIDNDGLHAEQTKTGSVNLKEGTHEIGVQYFQGPRTSIALQLFSNLEGEPEELFPGKLMVTEEPKNRFCLWWLLLLIIPILIFIYYRRRKLDRTNR